MDRRNLWWVGVRASDIRGIEDLFVGAISIVGTFANDKIAGISIEAQIGKRYDHNSPANSGILDDAILKVIQSVKRTSPEAKFLFQDQLCFAQSHEFFPGFVYNNPQGLIRPLNDKGTAWALISRYASTVGSTRMFPSELNYEALRQMFPMSRRFVAQVPDSAGGHGTMLVDSPESAARVAAMEATCLVVSEFRDKGVPMNAHVVVFQDQAILLPASAQLVAPDSGGRLLYGGCDFLFPLSLAESIRSRADDTCKRIGEVLRRSGYRGVVGIDYLLDGDEFVFVELNPRFQASTAPLNLALREHGLPSVHEMHMDAFDGRPAPEIASDVGPRAAFVHLVKGNDSYEMEPGDHCLSSPDSRDTPFSQDQVSLHVDMDTPSPGVLIDPGAVLGRVRINRPVLYRHPTMGPLSNHTLTGLGRHPPKVIEAATTGMPSALARLKFALFSQGARITAEAKAALAAGRSNLTIRDGIAGGLEVLLPHRVHVNVPVKEHFALLSPYAIDVAPAGTGFRLTAPNDEAIPLEILPLPDFVTMKTSRGTPMVEVGQMFNERLAIEIYFGCVNNSRDGAACQFCELGAEPGQSFADMADIRELVALCEVSASIPMRHVLVGGGTPPEPQWSRYFDALKVVRQETTLPIYMMLAPPNDLARLDELHARGLNEIGMNIELFDRDLARRFMPAKGKLPLRRYWDALERAVSLWGSRGAVRSILIVGLEPLESTLAGVEELCRRGVLPILSPYRPVPGTPLAHCPPPSPEWMFQAWARGQEIAERHGLVLGPTCIACQNNTIAMPMGDAYLYY